VFNISGLWNAIEALDGTIDPATQRAWFALVRDHVQMQMRIALKHFTAPMNLGQIIPAVSETVALLRAEWQKIVAPAQADKVRADIARYQSDGASLALATDLALLLPLDATFSIHAASTHQPSSGKKQATLAQTAACYYALVSALSIDVIYERLDTLPRTIHWQRHGIACAETALRQQLQRILGVILTRYGNAPDSVAQWLRSTDASFTRYQRCMASLTASGQFDIAMLMVVLDELTLFA
jgi:NAD-specific glutamate dehydrogenase